MTNFPRLAWHLTLYGLAAAGPTGLGWAVEAGESPPRSCSRQVRFQLSFAQKDLIWHGDPASPTATVFIRPGARPIATDLQLTTLTERHDRPHRRYVTEARIASAPPPRTVYAFTSQREKVVGVVDAEGRFLPNDFLANHRGLLPSWPNDATCLQYDPERNALYYEVALPGPVATESLDFLPLELYDARGQAVENPGSLVFTPAEPATQRPATLVLTLEGQRGPFELARAEVPERFRRSEVLLGSFDNASGTYLDEAAYRPGAATGSAAEASVTVEFPGELTAALDQTGNTLRLSPAIDPPSEARRSEPAITIDGNFDDWRNIRGVDDPRGDCVPYLEYVPDVDLVEFKVAHDARHLYLYARVAGQVGRTHPEGGRSYFYAYLDVDQDAGTGFLPSRDDDCYYGVDLGDDCEVQFEFVDNAFRKTFYGFCGLGGNNDVLRQQVTLGPSQYGRFDEQGREREHYKAEYTFRDGKTEITEDLKLGTSDTIRLAVSPDGSEVEVVSSFDGFLRDPSGRPTVSPGQSLDLAAGMECDSKAYPGKTRWAADSTPILRGYRLTVPAGRSNSAP